MSFYDNSSLAFLPSSGAGKDGKAYSIKPTNGTGDFTFSRGSNLAATRVGPTGLIEKGRENLLLQSNQFDTTWVKTSSITLTSGQSGYDGTNNAWLLERIGTGGQRLFQNISSSGVQTFSVYAKANVGDWLLLYIYTSGGDYTQWYNLSNGSLGASGVNIDASIESIGNGWYRCSVIFVGTTIDVRIYPVDGNGSIFGTNESIYIQDAQVEIGLAATDYIESGATTGKAGLLEDEPRFDYSGGATCPSLLLEPSRTNLIEYSEYIDGLDEASSPTLSLESETNPSGSAFAYKVIATATGSRVQQSIGTQGNNFVFSGFFKGTGVATLLRFRNNQGAEVQYNIDANGDFTLFIETAANDNYGIEDYGNGWYRIYFETTTASGGTDNYIQVYPDSSDGDGSVLVWGLQAEQGSYPTSYIPNHSGGTITRGAETPSNPSATSVIGQTEGTLFIDFLYESTASGNRFSISDGTATNWVFIGTPESGTSSRFYIRVNSSVIVDIGASSYFVSGQQYKLALAYKSGDWAAYGNGTQLYSGSDTIPSFSSAMDTINFKSYNPSDVITEREKVNQVLLFDTRLSNADLATLTT